MAELDLGVGEPHASLLPREALAEAAVAQLGSHGPPVTDFLRYGTAMYVAALAEYLSSRLGYVVPPGTLMETNGNSQALDMVVAHCTQPGDLVLVEDPTYHLAHQILRDRHVELVPVPQTTEEEEGGEGGHGTAADIAPSSSSSGGVGAATPSAPSLTYGGVSVDALEQLFVQRPELDRSRRQRPLLLYLVPTFNNPTGRCLSLRNRRRLVRLARHQNILLVADDVYQLLHYSPTAPPPPPLRQVALQEGAGDCVVSLGTFSKLLAPGLRLGWIEGPEPLVEKLSNCGIILSGGGLNPFTGTLVTHMLGSGAVDAQIDLLRQAYAQRVQLLCQTINSQLTRPLAVSPHGGFFVWLTLPEGVDAADMLAAARRSHGVAFHPGAAFTLRPGHCANSLRISFAFLSDTELSDAAFRLGSAIAEFCNLQAPAATS